MCGHFQEWPVQNLQRSCSRSRRFQRKSASGGLFLKISGEETVLICYDAKSNAKPVPGSDQVVTSSKMWHIPSLVSRWLLTHPPHVQDLATFMTVAAESRRSQEPESLVVLLSLSLETSLSRPTSPQHLHHGSTGWSRGSGHGNHWTLSGI